MPISLFHDFQKAQTALIFIFLWKKNLDHTESAA